MKLLSQMAGVSLANSFFPSLFLLGLLFVSPAAGELAPPRFEEEAPPCCRLEPDSMPGWKALFDGETLGDWQATNFGGQGGVEVTRGRIVLPMGDALTGVHWNGEALPESEYEICFEAMRISGSDFFSGLTFPVGSSHATLILGGWGGGLTGLSSIDSRDASENSTTRFMRFEDDRWYRIHLRVREGRIQAWLDEETLLDVATDGVSIDLRPGPIHLSRPLGITSFQTTAAVRDIKLRRIDGTPVFSDEEFASTNPLPDADMRSGLPKTRDTLWEFPEIDTAAEWRKRAEKIREQVLVSNGLWPLPEKAPLNARVFGKTEHDGYTIEKVLLETSPGFYLAGNLYRPADNGSGPFPGVLNPHGHWQNGRLTDTETGSIPARCIQMARMGMVAFAYDMVGYADTLQVDHAFARAPRPMLWNINLMGLQTWNSIRALDFLEGLPDVDSSRLAATGASGGATQTFILAALDDRLSVVAPNVMVSHSMQGGSLCENAPGLRVKYSNMEIAAAAAPRPQILVASAQDWTRETMTVEGPAVRSVYELLGVPNRLHSVIFDYPHNYNQTSREAVYGWFDAWLLNDGPSGRGSYDPIPEMPYMTPSLADLSLESEDAIPEDALGEEALIDSFISGNRSLLESLYPDPEKEGSLANFQETMLPAWRATFVVETPEAGEIIAEVSDAVREGDFLKRDVAFGRQGKGDRISGLFIAPERESDDSWVFVLAHAQGRAGFLDETGAPAGLAKELLEEGKRVLIPDLFETGENAGPGNEGIDDYLENHFTTYNRTDLQERVQDLVTAAAFARNAQNAERVAFAGAGRAGLWTLLAAPEADAVLADCDGFDSSNEDAYLDRDLFVPGILKLGAFEGVAMLAAANPLYLYNTEGLFSTSRLQQAYNAAGNEEGLHVEDGPVPAGDLAAWLAGLE